MMKTKSHTYVFWTATAIMLVLVGCYVVMIRYIKQQQHSVATHSIELAREVSREEMIRSTEILLRDLSEKKTLFDEFFIAPDKVVSAIERIEQLSQSVGVPITIADVNVQSDATETGEGTLSLNVSSEGTWTSMVHLTYMLDLLPFESSVVTSNLTLASNDDSERHWTLRSTIIIPLRH